LRRGIAPHRVVVVPDGVSDTLFLDVDRQVLKNEISRRLGIAIGDKKILLSVGRFVRRKGFDWFILNVVPRLLSRSKDWLYLLVGDGPLKEDIKEIIAQYALGNRIYLLGSIDDSTLRLIYNASDIFVMPNVSITGDIEGFGIVAAEAASCRIPVVASDLAGISSHVVDGSIGFLVRPLDAMGFANAIHGLLEQDDLRTEIGENAKRFALSKFEWRQIAFRYLKEFALAARVHQLKRHGAV